MNQLDFWHTDRDSRNVVCKVLVLHGENAPGQPDCRIHKLAIDSISVIFACSCRLN